MYCTKCGNAVDPEDKFCAQCGSPIKIKKEKSPPPAVSGNNFQPEKPRTGSKFRTPGFIMFLSSVKKFLKNIISNFKNKSRKKKLIIISIAGSAIILLMLALFIPAFLNLPGYGGSKWKYDKKIIEPVTAVSSDKDITLGELETHGVSLDIPADTFESQTTVKLSHPEQAPVIDRSAFTPAGAPVSIESSGRQKRLGRPVKVTMSIDNMRRDRSGAMYVAALNERGEWDYIVPDEIDLQNRRISFKTNHLGTYGLVNLKEEKLFEDFASRRSVRQWAEINLEFEAGQTRDSLVQDILQSRLGIVDEYILADVVSKIKVECPENKLVAAMVDRNVDMFIRSITTPAAAVITESVSPQVLKEAIEIAAGKPWAQNVSADINAALQAGDNYQAMVYILDAAASEDIDNWGGLVMYFFIYYDTGIWDSQEIEKAYQVYKNGTPDGNQLWGYEAQAGDFDRIWEQMRSAVEDIIVNQLIVSLDLEPGMDNADDLDAEEKDEFNQFLKERFKKQFEDRIKQELEIETIKENNGTLIKMLDKKGLLKTKSSNPAYNSQDDTAALLDRSYSTIEKIKRDLDRYVVVFEKDKDSKTVQYDPAKMIYAEDVVELVNIFYERGEQAYIQAIADMGLAQDKEAAAVEDKKYTAASETLPVQETSAAESETAGASDGADETLAPATEQTTAEEKETMSEAGTEDIEGLWEDEFGSIIKIIGNKGVYVKFSETMQEFADAGVLKLGDNFIKDITLKPEDDDDYKEWNSISLVLFSLDPYDPDALGWSDESWILLSRTDEFFILTVRATDPVTGEVYSGKTFIYERFTAEGGAPAPETD